MYEQYWSLSSPPFQNRISDRPFYESPVHEEALARLLYAVEQNKALAVLHGPRGCGKSQLLRMLAGQIRRTQRFLAELTLTNLSEREFLGQLETRLRVGGTETESRSAHWRRLRDFFESAGESRIQTVLLLDGLEHARDSALFAIRRLADLNNRRIADVTVILSLNPGQWSEGIEELLELADISVRLLPLERPQTESYINTRLDSAGSGRPLFSRDAIDQLHRLTGGVPREINRLCELALLAGMSESKTVLDRELIKNLSGEYLG